MHSATPTMPAITPATPFTHLLAQGLRLEGRRYARAQAIRRRGWIQLHRLSAQGAEATVSGHYRVILRRDGGGQRSCTCPDFQKRGGQVACKHLIALALEMDSLLGRDTPAESPEGDGPAEEPPPSAPAEPARTPFQEQVREAVGRAIAALASQVAACLAAGEIPFLVGPTGSGKSSAVRRVAVVRGWGLEEVAGSPSFADADVVGLRTERMEQPGILARAFRRARAGETVLCFFDEMLRFNVRVQDLLLRPLQPTPASVARSLGLGVDEPVRLVEAPLWGVEWAPVRRVHLVLAANPWGARPDPALVRRVWPIQVALSQEVAGLFQPPLADAIQASWRAVEQGELPLPLEYQALAQARHPEDSAILAGYLVRVAAVDRAAAEGFRAILEGMGVKTAAGREPMAANGQLSHRSSQP